MKSGSVGQLVPNTMGKILNPETNMTLGPGEPGELFIKGPQVMMGYYNDPVNTANCLSSDGWLKTGDIAYYDEDVEGEYMEEHVEEDEEELPFTFQEAAYVAKTDSSLLSDILEEQPELTDETDENGWNLLHWASYFGNLESVAVILKYQRDINIRTSKDNKGGNSVWIASEQKHFKVVEYLIANGAEMLQPIVDEVINESEEEKEDKDVEANLEEEIPFTFQEASYVAKTDSSLLSDILKKQPELTDETDKNGWNLLHRASYFGNLESVAVILKYQRDINIRTSKDNTGGNAVWIASEQKHFKVVEYLITKGARRLEPSS
jgi:ankyrin repeat protein